MQIRLSAVQGLEFQHYASYFISINPRFQWCASFFISVLIQSSVLCKNFQDFSDISTIPRSALFKAALRKALVYLLPTHFWISVSRSASIDYHLIDCHFYYGPLSSYHPSVFLLDFLVWFWLQPHSVTKRKILFLLYYTLIFPSSYLAKLAIKCYPSIATLKDFIKE